MAEAGMGVSQEGPRFTGCLCGMSGSDAGQGGYPRVYTTVGPPWWDGWGDLEPTIPGPPWGMWEPVWVKSMRNTGSSLLAGKNTWLLLHFLSFVANKIVLYLHKCFNK